VVFSDRMQVVTFDAAGTLIRTARPVGETYAEAAADVGVQVDAHAVMAAFRFVWKSLPPPLHPRGKRSVDDDRGWWKQLVTRVFTHVLGRPMQEEVRDELFEFLYAHYARPEAWSVFEDVRPALEELASHVRLFVLSNFDRRLRGILDGHGLGRFFEQVVISSEVGAAKPNPRMFEAVLELAGCTAADCLHVGDDVVCDIDGAQAAGMHAFKVTRPGQGLDVLVEKVRFGAFSGLHTPLS
jgi:putative hydrolase of the HAD superfamily